MVYSDTTNKNGIVQMQEQTTGLGATAITSNAQNFAYFNALTNDFYRVAAYLAWKLDKSWVFDDSNQTTFPTATTTLVNNQRDYTLPTGTLKVRQVEVMDTNGKYFTLNYLEEESSLLLSEKEQETAGIPQYYRLVGNSLILYPNVNTSQVTAAAGLRLTMDREIDPFTVSDTTQEPGIPKFLQPILYYGPSYVWASVKGNGNVANLCLKMLGNFPGLMDMVSDYFSKRNEDKIPVLRRATQSYK